MTTRDDISAAHDRIAPWLRRTPVMDVRLPGIEQPVTLKLEYLQLAGVFKARGAFNSLIGNETAKTAGVAAASGGNHGAAVACAAQALGLKARIFVPSISSPAKVARIRHYGAEVVQDGAVYAEAQALCEAYVAETGAVQIHPYDAPATIAGQGTLAVELEQQAPDLDTVLVAVGGGGLIAGVAGWYEDRIRTVSVEPETSCALHAAHAAGEPVKVDVSGIAADSLGASTIGTLPFKIAQPACHRLRACVRRWHRPRPALAVGQLPHHGRARCLCRHGRPAGRRLQAHPGRKGLRHHLRRQRRSGKVCHQALM
jgi:threonine dehydratase